MSFQTKIYKSVRHIVLKQNESMIFKKEINPNKFHIRCFLWSWHNVRCYPTMTSQCFPCCPCVFLNTSFVASTSPPTHTNFSLSGVDWQSTLDAPSGRSVPRDCGWRRLYFLYCFPAFPGCTSTIYCPPQPAMCSLITFQQLVLSCYCCSHSVFTQSCIIK